MRIGICFPTIDFENMEFDQFCFYLLELKQEGVNSIDFYSNFFLDGDYKKDKLLKTLIDNDIKITLHYVGDLSLAYVNIEKIHNYLDKFKIEYEIPITFHLPSYDDNKYEFVNDLISFFTDLTKKSKEFNFDILVETLSYNHPNNQNLGDDLSEIQLFLDKVDLNNFGFCWDIGHTYLNSIETKSTFIPKDINRLKMTHIHGVDLKTGLDHIPFYDLKGQREALTFLVASGYKGPYSLEFPFDNIKENFDIYIKCIRYLRALIETMEL